MNIDSDFWKERKKTFEETIQLLENPECHVFNTTVDRDEFLANLKICLNFTIQILARGKTSS